MGQTIPVGTLRRPLCVPRPAGTPLYAALPSMKTAHSLRNAASYREICREVRRRQETARPPDSLQRARLWVQPHRIRSGTHRRERRTMRLPKQRGTAEQTVFRKAIKAVLPRRQGRRQRHRRQGPLCRAEMRKLPEGAAWVGHPQDGILMFTTVQMTGNKPVPEGNQASRKEAMRGTAVQSVERAGNIRRPSDMPHNRTGAGQTQNPSAKPAPPHGRADAGGRQAQQNPLPKPPPPRGRNGRQGDDRK